MAERPTDEQIAELDRVTGYSYEAGGYPAMSEWADAWTNGDGGLLNTIRELRAERARWEQEERQKLRMMVQCSNLLGRAEAAESGLAEAKRIRHGDPAMFGAVFGFELGEAEGSRERVKLRSLVDVLRKSRQMWRDRTDGAEAKVAAVAAALREAGIGDPLGAGGVYDLAAMALGRLEDLQAAEAKVAAVRERVEHELQNRYRDEYSREVALTDVVDILDGQEKPTDAA